MDHSNTFLSLNIVLFLSFYFLKFEVLEVKRSYVRANVNFIGGGFSFHRLE